MFHILLKKECNCFCGVSNGCGVLGQGWIDSGHVF